MLHNQSFSRDVVNTYRAWDELSRREDDDNRIIDIDVAPRYENSLVFDTTEQVTIALEDLLDRAPHSGDYSSFTAAKLRASLLHLHLLGGEKVTLREHVETAMGVTPEKVDEAVIDDYRTRLDSQLAEHGLGFDREFENALVVDEEEEVLRNRLLLLGEQGKVVTSKFVETAGIPDIQPQIVSEDEAWVGWAGTDDAGELVDKINIHPRHKHTIARLAAIVIHEVQGHITQFSIWRNKIQHGELDPAMGVTTLHTPENTQAEFNAQTIEQIGLRALATADKEDGWQYEFQAGYHDYSGMVAHNAHLMINSGYQEDQVIDYATNRLPFTSVENITKAIPARRRDPMYRGYFACYQPAMAAGRLLLAQDQAAQKAVLQETFSRPMTLAQIEALITS